MAGKRVKAIWKEYWKEYKEGNRAKKWKLLGEFCRRTGYNRKYAIQLLGRPAGERRKAKEKLAAASPRHVASTGRGTRRYLNMARLEAPGSIGPAPIKSEKDS